MNGTVRNVRQIVSGWDLMTCERQIVAAETMVLKGSSYNAGVSGTELALISVCKKIVFTISQSY